MASLRHDSESILLILSLFFILLSLPFANRVQTWFNINAKKASGPKGISTWIPPQSFSVSLCLSLSLYTRGWCRRGSSDCWHAERLVFTRAFERVAGSSCTSTLKTICDASACTGKGVMLTEFLGKTRSSPLCLSNRFYRVFDGIEVLRQSFLRRLLPGRSNCKNKQDDFSWLGKCS